MKSQTLNLLSIVAILALTNTCFADSMGEPGHSSGEANPLKNVYFGEEHLHTQASPDSFATGNRGTWDDAYNYAKGKEIKLSTTGAKLKKKTPYDFVAITDHAEYFGVMPRLIDPKDALSKSSFAQELAHPTKKPSDPTSAINTILGSILTSTGMPEYVKPELIQENWAKYVKVANKHNDPGTFTTLIGFEWTSIPNGRNMHRNVFWRDSGPKAPFSAFDSIFPEDLWTYQEVQRNEGHDNLAIPHNGNVSDGWMYAKNKFLGGPIDARYAKRQALNEPLTEIIQVKGASETHPIFSPNDEFADFELFTNMINVGMPSQVKYGYIRQGLVEGMILENTLGFNPYKYGIAAGSDSHSAHSNNEEFNMPGGAHGKIDDTVEKRLNPAVTPSGDVNAAVGSSGITAVWAPQNTREAIFDAMQAKETYGTSGTMIRLRFFGGWDFPKNLVNDKNFVKMAYANGVPMGQDLPKKGSAKAPTFAVWALKDPESGNLDRIQIIKGFINKWNRPDEKIYDVALSDNRKVDPKTGKAPAVGNSVDLKTATYTNDIGDTQLSTVWTDPDFDPAQKAVYYVRVLEIPTPRWSTYDAVRNDLPLSTIVPATIQERAWSSPIWYAPSK